MQSLHGHINSKEMDIAGTVPEERQKPQQVCLEADDLSVGHKFACSKYDAIQ